MLNTFSLAFLAALLAMCALRLWLAQRQISHVMAHRGRVPENFADRIDLAAHQKGR
jgi:STE24 endopeptidase